MRRLGNMSGGAVLREGAAEGTIFCVNHGGERRRSQGRVRDSATGEKQHRQAVGTDTEDKQAFDQPTCTAERGVQEF